MTLEIMQPETSQYNEYVHTVCCSRKSVHTPQYASYNIIVPVTNSTVGQGPGYAGPTLPGVPNAEPALFLPTTHSTVGREALPSLKF
jgi:hypothetical protein